MRAPSLLRGKCGHGVDSALPLCVWGGHSPLGGVSRATGHMGDPSRLCVQDVPETPGSLDVAVRRLLPRTPVSLEVMDKVGSWMN